MTRSTRWHAVLAAVAGGLLLLAGLTGWALARRYHPNPWGTTGLPAIAWTRRLARWHQTSIAVAVPATVAWTMLLASSRQGRRRGIALAAAGVAAVLALTAALTWDLVRFDQVALRTVTVGLSERGLWWPAFDGDVRFLLIGGDEVSQPTYARWLLVHLLAPLVALIAVGASWWASTPPAPTAPDGRPLARRHVSGPGFEADDRGADDRS